MKEKREKRNGKEGKKAGKRRKRKHGEGKSGRKETRGMQGGKRAFQHLQGDNRTPQREDYATAKEGQKEKRKGI